MEICSEFPNANLVIEFHVMIIKYQKYQSKFDLENYGRERVLLNQLSI